MEEIWRPIPGFPGYEISNFGQVKSYRQYKAGQLLTLHRNKKGYLQVRLQDIEGAQATKFVHRLVLLTFSPVENCENLTVDHIDCNPSNNRLDNLRWLTPEENLKRATLQSNWGQHCYNYSRKGGQIKITYEDGKEEIYPNLMRAVEATGMCKKTLNRYIENPNGFPGQRKKIKVEIISGK